MIAIKGRERQCFEFLKAHQVDEVEHQNVYSELTFFTDKFALKMLHEAVIKSIMMKELKEVKSWTKFSSSN